MNYFHRLLMPGRILPSGKASMPATVGCHASNALLKANSSNLDMPCTDLVLKSAGTLAFHQKQFYLFGLMTNYLASLGVVGFATANICWLLLLALLVLVPSGIDRHAFPSRRFIKRSAGWVFYMGLLTALCVYQWSDVGDMWAISACIALAFGGTLLLWSKYARDQRITR